MKKLLLASASCLLIVVAGCSAFKYGAPPTKAEQKLYDIATNYTPVVLAVTNYVPVTVYQTNVQPVQVVTNNQTVTEYHTNVVAVTVTNAVAGSVTNQQRTYTYTPNETAKGIAGGVGAIAAPFGWGGVASSGLLALTTLWGWFRSSKLKNTGASLAQGIETLRVFIQSMPNGNVYDSALTQWLSDHQKETGTVNQVLDLLESSVSNADAQIAAQQIRAAIAALNPSAIPPIVPRP